MTTFLSIALLFIGSAGTLAAFGGKTWNEGKEPILERITVRGWISLICLILALALGAMKEIQSSSDDRRKENDAKSVKDESDKKQAALAAALRESQLEQKLAGKGVESLQIQAADAQEQLKSANVALVEVTGNLNKAEDELDRQGRINLMTALENSGERVSDIQFFIPFTENGNEASTIHDVFLPTIAPQGCLETTEVTMVFWLGGSKYETLTYNADDKADHHNYFDQSPPKTDLLFHSDDPQSAPKVVTTRFFLGQKTTNSQAYAAAIHVSDRHESAAHFLFPREMFSSYPITISALTEPKSIAVETSDKVFFEKNPRYLPGCEEAIKKYFQVAFEKAYIGITLSQKQDVTIYIGLKALPPQGNSGVMKISFQVDSKPQEIVTDDLNTLLTVDWPPNGGSPNPTQP